MVRTRKEIILHHVITKELVFASLPLEAWGWCWGLLIARFQKDFLSCSHLALVGLDLETGSLPASQGRKGLGLMVATEEDPFFPGFTLFFTPQWPPNMSVLRSTMHSPFFIVVFHWILMSNRESTGSSLCEGLRASRCQTNLVTDSPSEVLKQSGFCMQASSWVLRKKPPRTLGKDT